MIKCRIFTGTKFEEDGKIRFLDETTEPKQPDEGYIDYFDEKEFELKIKKYALPLGMFIDAYDKNNKLFWSNYRKIEEKPDIDSLRKEYKELSGEDSKGNWGVKKLSEEIDKLKEN